MGGVQGLERMLRTSVRQGLPSDSGALQSRIEAYGINTRIARVERTLWDMVA